MQYKDRLSAKTGGGVTSSAFDTIGMNWNPKEMFVVTLCFQLLSYQNPDILISYWHNFELSIVMSVQHYIRLPTYT
jgi:hypothetical protein